MLRLIGIFIILIIILAGVDYIIVSSGSQTKIITITNKYVDGSSYFIETMAFEKLKTSHDLYYELKSGNTYKVKVFNGEITEIVNIINSVE